MFKIFCKNTELPLVLETLTLTKKNSVFSDTFSMDYSKNPFLIIENNATEKALGSRHIMSLNKKLVYDVTVFRDNKVYFGKLKVRSYSKGTHKSFRKCDIVFGSEIIKILDKKIADFMPVVYMDPNYTEPYSEITSVDFDQDTLLNNLLLHEKKSYPEVDFQFPEIYAPDWYGVEDDIENDWVKETKVGGEINKEKKFKSYLNKRENNKLSLNEIISEDEMNIAYNYTSFKPMVFLLSALKYPFKSIGYEINISNASSFDKILMSTPSDNSCLLDVKRPIYMEIPFSRYREYSVYSDVYRREIYSLYKPNLPNGDWIIRIEASGVAEHNPQYDHIVNMKNPLRYKIRTTTTSISSAEIVDKMPVVTNGEFSDEFNFTKNINDETDYLRIECFFSYEKGKTPRSLKFYITKDYKKNKLVKHHPSVDLARYVPDWTVAENITNLKKLFNFKIGIDDSIKEIKLDTTDDYVRNFKYVDLSHCQLEEKSYTNNQINGFKIKYTNDEFANINSQEVHTKLVKDEDIVTVDNEFYTPTFNGSHHHIKKEDEDKIALFFNNETTPNTKYENEGVNLNLATPNGVGVNFWKSWVRFRELSSKIELVGKVNKHDLIKIQEYEKVYWNNVMYLVEKVVTKKKNGFSETTLTLHSKMF